MKLCPKCGTQYPDDANFCPIDAGRLSPAPARERAGAAGSAAAGGSHGAARTTVTAETRTPDGRRVLGGRFALGTRIGGRQTGEVYEATDLSNGQACVVKVVDAEVFPSNLVMQRTERELGKLARLDASGIARILDHGRVDGRLWTACEQVPGCRSLLDIVFDEGPMPAQRAASILLEVGKALSEAARVGVIHRDLAPKNVLLGADGTVKLINFGVALPSMSKVQGVPEFVAPEIVEGKPVDQRANIYSLGALFYYLAAGRPPYMGEPEEVYEQHLSGEPEPPSTHLEGIPEAVDAVILRALARTSSRRFMTLRQLLNDVERIAAGEEPATTSPAMSAFMPRGKGKAKKLAQTMLGGFQVAQEAARAKTAPPEATAAAQAGAAQPANGADAGMQAALEVSGTIGGQESGDQGRPARAMDAAAAGSDGQAEALAPGGEARAPDRAAGGEAQAGFREAGWFQRGAAGSTSGTADRAGSSRAATGAPGEAGSAAGSASGRARPGDAGSADRAHGLKAGAAEVTASARAGKTPREDVASRELIDEMNAGRGKIVAAIVIAIVLLAALIAYAVTG